MSENDSSSPHDKIQAAIPVEVVSHQAEQTKQELLKDSIDQVLQTLTYSEREIIKCRYGLDGPSYTQHEVRRIYKKSVGYIVRTEARAVRKLQHPVRSRQLEGFRDTLATEGPAEPEGYFYLLQDVLGAHSAQREPNLFHFATSELSQDAFLCWLLAWADRWQQANDPALYHTAVNLLNRLLGLHGIPSPEEYETLKIERQFEGLDILVLANDNIAILIEDKTVTSEHSNQLPRYLNAVHKNYPDRWLAPVYLKTGDLQCYEAVLIKEAGWRCFLRRHLIEVLAYGKRQAVKSDIFRDFHSRLMRINRKSWENRTRRSGRMGDGLIEEDEAHEPKGDADLI